MSSDQYRRGFLLCTLAAVAGCGFAPAYGTNGTASQLRGTVKTIAPDTVLGFQLRAHIDDRLRHATAPRYHLNVTLADNKSPATVNPDGDTTRFQLSGQADWTLTDTNGSQHATGRAQAFSSYAATGSTVATQASADDAARRLAILLADEILSDLITMAGDLP